jgi:hypothetical protein
MNNLQKKKTEITSDKMPEQERHLSDGSLDGLRGNEERHQISGRHLLHRQQVAAVVQCPQHNSVQK